MKQCARGDKTCPRPNGHPPPCSFARTPEQRLDDARGIWTEGLDDASKIWLEDLLKDSSAEE